LDEAVQNAVYKHPEPAALTLFTMVNSRSGTGVHTSLMINASQRIIFDPAGTLRHVHLPEKEDAIYGITPAVEDFYVRAHARKTHHVVIQKRIVPPEVAEQALQLALAHGAVNSAECSLRTSQLLTSLPGFEALPISLFPNRLRLAFGALGGVSEKFLHEYDEADKPKAFRAYVP
jgi:hypothetical protein